MNQEFDIVVIEEYGDCKVTTCYKKFQDYLDEKIYKVECSSGIDVDLSGLIKIGDNK